jgi:hypothetical protein
MSITEDKTQPSTPLSTGPESISRTPPQPLPDFIDMLPLDQPSTASEPTHGLMKVKQKDRPTGKSLKAAVSETIPKLKSVAAHKETKTPAKPATKKVSSKAK